MKKMTALILALSMVFLLLGCTPAEETVLTPTGYPSGEIQRPQIMYNGKVYIYGATGFNEPLPIIYAPVGHVKAIDNINAPTQDFTGAQVELRQTIYASEKDPSSIYVAYNNGYARFFVEGYQLQEVFCYVYLATEDGLYVKCGGDFPDIIFISYPGLQDFTGVIVYATFSITDLKEESGTFTDRWGQLTTYSHVLENVTNVRMPNPGEPTYG